MKTIKIKVLTFIQGFFILNLLWYIAAKALKIPALPVPQKIYSSLGRVVSDKLYIHLGYSLFRISSAIIISLIIGLAIGILMGYSKLWNSLLNPLVYFTYPIPKISLLPVIMLLFGLREKSKIIMIVLIIVFQIIIAVRDAVLNIPKETYHALKSMGASKFQMFLYITLPAAFSEILTSVRIALGTAISVLFFTEVYGTRYGLGYFIMDAWMRIDYIEMYCGIVVVSLLGFILFASIDTLEGLICKGN